VFEEKLQFHTWTCSRSKFYCTF